MGRAAKYRLDGMVKILPPISKPSFIAIVITAAAVVVVAIVIAISGIAAIAIVIAVVIVVVVIFIIDGHVDSLVRRGWENVRLGNGFFI